jgi:hypothetical protein
MKRERTPQLLLEELHRVSYDTCTRGTDYSPVLMIVEEGELSCGFSSRVRPAVSFREDVVHVIQGESWRYKRLRQWPASTCCTTSDPISAVRPLPPGGEDDNQVRHVGSVILDIVLHVSQPARLTSQVKQDPRILQALYMA